MSHCRLATGVVIAVLGFFCLLVSPSLLKAQTSTSGALRGTLTDPSGRALMGAQVKITNEGTGEVRTTSTQGDGTYLFPLLPPGTYRLEASKSGFKAAIKPGIRVQVTETAALNFGLELGDVHETVTVVAQAEMLETTSAALGSVVSEQNVAELPLATRNYTQILALSPGVASEVTSTTAPGRGQSGESGSGEGMEAHGSSDSDNNFEMDGVGINDIQGSGDFSGGVAIPNPDTIAEFKVQTGQYDASFGRNAGAQVSIVSKSGSNQFHGTLFEFFRNDDLNANDFFRNEAGQGRPVMKQNQFGFTFGGPIKKDKLLFFGSYQGTRQRNGEGGGLYQCASTVTEPALTNDRSAAALGTLFAGQRGYIQNYLGSILGFPVGPAIAADGSNINPVALSILQFKLPDGSYLIPTPQTIINGQGFSALSIPCPFSANQFMTNVDYLMSSKSTLSGRFFVDAGTENAALPPTSGESIPGSPVDATTRFWNVSLTHTYVFNSHVLNRATLGYHRINDFNQQGVPFSYSDVGATATGPDNTQPIIAIAGSIGIGGTGQSLKITQNTFTFQDAFSYLRGRHSFKLGGGISRIQNDQTKFEGFGLTYFLTFADFLLGLNGTDNGTAPFIGGPGYSNIYISEDLPGLFDRAWRALDGDAYAQDDIRVTSRLTFNVGVRYEHVGDFAEIHGRNSSFNPALANPTPPVGGTLAGYVVSSNYPGTVPAGVSQVSNQFGINGDGQNVVSPRIGFAWQLPHTKRFVLRGGYGLYSSRSTGQSLAQQITSPPFGDIRALVGVPNGAATFQNPFQPFPAVPSFPLITPTSTVTLRALAPNFQPAALGAYGLSLQAELADNWMLEVGYQGNHGTKQYRTIAINQALSASPSNPIRGQTTNTLANLDDRLPLQGFTPDGIYYIESEGFSWYNDLEASLTKRFSHGLQFLASYTFARALSSEASSTSFSSASGTGFANGDQDGARSRYGPSFFNRANRLVISYNYQLPTVRAWGAFGSQVLGGWSLSGVTVAQTGQPMTITGTNFNNLFGISEDRAQLAPSCTNSQVGTLGSARNRLNNYFNKSCVGPWPVISSDGGTAFGNMGVGIVNGPGQFNFDLSAIKHTKVRWPSEVSDVEFRAEFFNAFNHPQFANPDTNASDTTFGDILNTSVSPRVMQFALKFSF